MSTDTNATGPVFQFFARNKDAMENENSRLKRLVADQAVQIQILKEVLTMRVTINV